MNNWYFTIVRVVLARTCFWQRACSHEMWHFMFSLAPDCRLLSIKQLQEDYTLEPRFRVPLPRTSTAQIYTPQKISCLGIPLNIPSLELITGMQEVFLAKSRKAQQAWNARNGHKARPNFPLGNDVVQNWTFQYAWREIFNGLILRLGESWLKLPRVLRSFLIVEFFFRSFRSEICRSDEFKTSIIALNTSFWNFMFP